MNEGNFSLWGPTLASPWSHKEWYVTEHMSMRTRVRARTHTHTHTRRHWCSWETLSSHNWAFILEEQDGGKYLVNLPALEEEALQLSLHEDSLINFSAERNRTQLATVPNTFETWKFELLDLFCDDRGTSIDADLPNTKILLENHSKEWAMNLLKRNTTQFWSCLMQA